MISRRTVNGRSNLLNESKRFRCKMRFFDKVAGETNELGRKLIDRAHHVGGVTHVAFMMEVSKVDEAAITRASLQIEFRDLQRCRYVPA